MAWLYDFYGSLLTEKYYHQDFSLAEIASLTGISRQAVYDLLKRSENALEDYEASLGFLEKYLEQQKIVAQLRELLLKAQVQEDLFRGADQLLTSLLEVYQET